MSEQEREQAQARVWASMKPHGYTSHWNGQRCVLIMRERGTTIVPLVELTDEELKRLGGES